MQASLHSIELFKCALLVVNVVNQAFILNDLLHEWRKCLPLIPGILCLIVDDTTVKIDLYFITVLDTFCCFRALNDRKSDIDRVTIENSCKCICDNTAYTGCFNRDRCMLSGGTTAKVLFFDVFFVSVFAVSVLTVSEEASVGVLPSPAEAVSS